ncbi:MAG: N-formylglutamate amidohydrolase [Betaproteobacteria bacterium]
MTSDLLWIDAGRRFGFDDLVFRHDRQRPFAQVAGAIDTIVLGPHASAAFPAELRPFIAPALTRRKQCDFSDIITASLGRAWVAADPRVVYVENPVSRLVLDPNRAPPADPIAGLREFYRRLARQRAGEPVGFGGVDAVRPITFGGEDVLVEPDSAAAWQTLATTLADVAARTVTAYRACCDEVLRTVIERRPANAPLRVFSLHDTMNTKMRADGAIVVERAPADRLPLWAKLCNNCDSQFKAQYDKIKLE